MPKTDAGRLADYIAITQLKARYGRCIDLKRWDVLPTLFTADARCEGFGGVNHAVDIATFVAGVAKRLDGAVTVHHFHQPDVVFTGADRAKAIWAMMDYNEWPRPIGLPGAPEAPGFQGFGFYEEAYRRVGEAWRIDVMRLVRLRVDPLPQRDPAQPGPFTPAPGWLRPSPDWLGVMAAR